MLEEKIGGDSLEGFLDALSRTHACYVRIGKSSGRSANARLLAFGGGR